MPLVIDWTPPLNVEAYEVCELQIQESTDLLHLYLQIKRTRSERSISLEIYNTIIEGIPVSLAVPAGHERVHGAIAWRNPAFVAFVKQQWDTYDENGPGRCFTISSDNTGFPTQASIRPESTLNEQGSFTG